MRQVFFLNSVYWRPAVLMEPSTFLLSIKTTAVFNKFLISQKFVKFAKDLELISSLEGHENEVKCVRWHSNGTYFASCGRDKTVWIWGIEENREIDCVAILNGHTQDVKFIAWHPIDSVLFSCSYDETIRVWKVFGKL
ncbi:cytosolic Fe-S cluster assembly factor cfd1, variant 2 [Bonamia ostreae]|uniref:Cytosolic Fe-S cluster assembly factor cfd1, variant 2 n=1 Tax=Bonamia ostreae TaxID=126728 RepID=A0ABV2AU23_9EUKA